MLLQHLHLLYGYLVDKLISESILEIRVKGCPNEDSQNKQEEDFDIVSFISYVLENIFGVRV